MNLLHQNLTFSTELLGPLLYKSLPLLDKAIIACTDCPRLVEWREEVALTKRKAYEKEKYWGKAVPGFGPIDAQIVLVGLAPGAHGANRTGRIFTGDSSGDWLYRSLHKAGLAKIPTSTSRNDGQELINTRITCAVHCAPPDNKPSTEEKHECHKYLLNELELLLPTARVFVALGNVAWTSIFASLMELGESLPKPRPAFGHGVRASFVGGDGVTRNIIASYHPSQQNTFTGKLTESMLDSLMKKAGRLASKKSQ
jgi:uracil-DNA glycosylase family 4